ncbi:hypothetical protein QE381_001721 [Microbacterium sp. SORGH_AS 888]|nr:hypothetical protein [Microbacterium sp. SORGH_AS_0888]
MPFPRSWSPRPTWKRTAKSADFDLVIDPVDEEGNVPSWCTLTSATTPRAARTVATEAWRRAQHDFAQVVTPEDLRMLFVRRSEMTFRRFGLDHYMQTDIARGLLEISLGREAEGEARLRRFCERFDVDIEDRILRAAVSDARLRARENGFQ